VEVALTPAAGNLGRSDHKSALQELLQARGMPPCNYRVVEEAGPDHEKTFRVEVRITGELTAAGNRQDQEGSRAGGSVAALYSIGVEGEGSEQKHD